MSTDQKNEVFTDDGRNICEGTSCSCHRKYPENFLMIDATIATKYPDGQKLVRIPEDFIEEWKNSMDDDVVLGFVWSWENLQLLIGARAVLSEWGIKPILYMPYVFGARADRQFNEFEPSYFRDVVAPILRNLDFEIIYGMDAHSDVVSACLTNYVELGNEWMVESLTSSLTGSKCLIIPDAGAAKKADKLGKYFDLAVQCVKHRDIKTGKILGTEIIGKVPKADHYVIVDDICDGGATFLALSLALRAASESVHKESLTLCVTHGIFSKSTEELEKHFREIVYTNSLRPNEKYCKGRLSPMDIWDPNAIQSIIMFDK